MLAGVAALAPAAALASFPGADGVIAYADEGSIWALEPQTGDQLRLTSGPDDEAPSFSPSGNTLAFQRYAGSATTIFLAGADGSNAHPLLAGREPAFSPSGQQIVFVRAAGLFLTDVTPGSPVRQITDHRGDSEPRWSSTGEIVFERAYRLRVSVHGVVETPFINQLDIIRPPSLKVHALLTYEQPAFEPQLSEHETELHPDWSPNGRALAVALCNSGPAHPPFETVPALVFHTSCAPDVWAPEGRRLAEPGSPPLAGAGYSSCPLRIYESTEISWQPLVSGSLRVPVVKCEPHEPPPGPVSGTLPAKEVLGSRTCFYNKRKHTRICYTT